MFNNNETIHLLDLFYTQMKIPKYCDRLLKY